MRKYILKNRIFIYILLAIIGLGYIEGLNMGMSLESYMTTFCHRPVLYSFLILILFVDYVMSKKYIQTSFIFRYDNFLSLVLNNLKREFLMVGLLFLCFHIGICIVHMNLMIQIMPMVIKLFLNYIVVTFLILSFIKLIDIKIGNQVVSIILFIGLFAFVDIGVELYEVLLGNRSIFTLQFIFIIPYVYQFYIVIDICLLMLVLFGITLFCNLIVKKDYLIHKIYVEN